jgi:hypothetical protein
LLVVLLLVGRQARKRSVPPHEFSTRRRLAAARAGASYQQVVVRGAPNVGNMRSFVAVKERAARRPG